MLFHIQKKMESLSDDHLDKTAEALNTTTDAAVQNPSANPKDSIHAPADHPSSHSFLQRHFPQAYLDTVEANWHMGNYVIDRKTGQKSFEAMSIYVRMGMHLLYYGKNQENMLHWKKTLALLKEQSEKMGREYDAPESRDHIQPFIDAFQLQGTLSQLKEPDPTKYPNFNAFFAREIREDARPIDEPDNKLVVSSPADCRLTTFPTIDLATKYWIKGEGFTIQRLLGDDAQLAQQFDGGVIMIARLAPQDYHRWHSPINGSVVSTKTIPGTYYTVNPQAINEQGAVDVFCENKRDIMVLKRTETGHPVVLVAVGAMLVGSSKYVEPLGEPGAEVHRGQCLGAFYYGGSTVIVLYPPGEITIDEDLVKNSTEQNCETLMSVGWRCGVGPTNFLEV